MSDTPILPTANDVVVNGVDKLRELRPGSTPFLNDDLAGNYGKIVHGVRSQAILALNHLTDGVANGRLTTSSGDGLRALVATEFSNPQSFDPTFAVGSVTLTRTGTLPSGSIKSGTRIQRRRNTTFTIPYGDATYSTTIDVFVTSGQTSVTIPIVAQTSGSIPNHVVAVGLTPPVTDLSIGDAIFDSAFSITAFECAGGVDSVPDPFLRQFATSSSLGKFVPNNDAVIAGCLGALGVRHVLVKDDYINGICTAFIADQSWASSTNWANKTQRNLTDNNVIGFGSRIQVLPSNNIAVAVTANVTLRRTDYLSQTDDITVSIQNALRAYFDDRLDWDIFRLNSIKGVIARADVRILTCTLASVVYNQTGGVVSEPTQTKPPFSAFQANHFYMVDNGSKFNYLAPV